MTKTKPIQPIIFMDILKQVFFDAGNITHCIDRLGYYVSYDGMGAIHIDPPYISTEQRYFKGYRKVSCECDCGHKHQRREKVYGYRPRTLNAYRKDVGRLINVLKSQRIVFLKRFKNENNLTPEV